MFHPIDNVRYKVRMDLYNYVIVFDSSQDGRPFIVWTNNPAYYPKQ